MERKIYLDNNATTAVDPKVIDQITLALHTLMGNPSSAHAFGRQARGSLQKARDEIANFLKVTPREIIFTSGATEGLNLLLRSLLEGSLGHVITSSVEHAAVYSTLKDLEKKSLSVSFLNPGLYGAITLDAVKEAYRKETSLIVLMAVNNETGVKTDIEAIAAFAKEKKIHLIVDGVALLGKELFTIADGISAICFSGHKLHAPKGIGFIYLSRHLKLKPYLTGGDQEFGLRGGTENMMGIIGLQEAIKILRQELPSASKKMEFLRDKLENTLQHHLPNVTVNGTGPRIVNTSNLMFRGIDGELLMTHLDTQGIAVSLGSACASGSLEPSRVLLNMGLTLEEASSSLRFSLSRFTTEEEIDLACNTIINIIQKLTPPPT